MTETAEHPTPAVLRQLSTLREFPADNLQALAEELCIHQARKGSVLLDIGGGDETTLYLLEGACRLIAEDGGEKRIRHTDPSALAPLARLRPSRYRVIADSPVRYLRIDNGLLDASTAALEPSSSLDSYEVEEEEDFGHLDASNQLTLHIYEDLNAERLLLPSLPHVAMRIGEAVNDEHADAKRIAALIETDPAIAVKIVKAANSARYGGIAHVGTVTEAVARLGLQNTQLLVITFALRELFRTHSKALEERMLDLWEHSRRIAALTQVLADKVGGFNRHEALLAGLVHDIGVLAVIGYARDFADVVDNPAALEASIQALRSQLGGMILAKWQLPAELVAAAKGAEDWYRNHTGQADYADLVIVAQIHDGIAGDLDPAQVPALAHLGLSPEEIDRGIDLLHGAADEVAEARRLLAG
jgi:HD-like signal output (HDOD) protein